MNYGLLGYLTIKVRKSKKAKITKVRHFVENPLFLFDEKSCHTGCFRQNVVLDEVPVRRNGFMMVSFVLSFFPRDVLDEILNLIESVSEDFPSYS